eukprot:3609514-Pyramimonas_sp.AAC.1
MKDIALVAGDGITDIFKAFHAAGETKFSIAAHVSMTSGSEDGSGVTDEEPMKSTKTIILKEIALDQVMQSIPECEQKEVLVAAHTSAKNYIQTVGDQAMGISKAELDNRVNHAAKWAKGGADGESWWGSANDANDLSELLPMAKET